MRLPGRAASRSLALLVWGATLAACDGTSVPLAIGAAADAVQAATLSDADVVALSARAAAAADARHPTAAAGSPQAQRLARLVGRRVLEEGRAYDVAVSVSPEVNAFATADGTIRIHGGLLELLDDGELQFVVGHEMGHVARDHVRKKLRLAYAASAVRKGVASQGGITGDVAGSIAGGLAEALLNAQFSQFEEKEADDHGLAYLRRKGLDPAAAVSALRKLAGLGRGHSFLASHPDPGLRAERLLAQIEGRALPVAETTRGFLGRLRAAWDFVGRRVLAPLSEARSGSTTGA